MQHEGPIEAAISTDLRGEPYNFSVWDTYSGAQLVVFKGIKSPVISKCLQLIDNNYFVTANDNIVYTWSLFNKKCQDQKLFLPGRPSCLCISPCGNYLIAGINETMSIWNFNTGNLMASVQKHYQNISAIKMSNDGSFVITAGEDGVVHVWCFADLICKTSNTTMMKANASEQINGKSGVINEPLYSWANHDAQVTDLYVTASGLTLTTSVDKTVNIYDLLTGKRLSCVMLPSELWSVVMNKNETQVFVGGHDGDIYEIVISSIGMSLLNSSQEDKTPIFKGHTNKVNLLKISLDGSRLISGSSDNSCKTWNIQHKKMLQDINHQGSLANLSLLFVPDALAIKSMTATKPPRLCRQLKRNEFKLTNKQISFEDIFDDAIYVKHRQKVWQEEQLPLCTSETEIKILTPAKESQSNVDILKEKLKSLYKFAADKIFKDAADEALRPFNFKNIAENHGITKRKLAEIGVDDGQKRLKN